MITLSKFNSSTIVNFVRSFKVSQFGVKTAKPAAPFGDDSEPLKDMMAIFAETSNNAEPVIIGYLNKNQIAGPGEKRTFSLQPDGKLSAYIWLKNDETIELFGSEDNLVRYSALESQFNELKEKFNQLITAYNTHTHSNNGAAPPVPQGVPSTANITLSRIDNIKTN